MKRIPNLKLTAAVACTLALGSAAPAFGASVGTAGAVNPFSTGTPPGGSSRTLEIGSSVVFKERIVTNSGGSLQVLFVDKTTLSIGPGSDITIDEFVYNPEASTGTFVASIAKGSFRFVGGQISHDQGATLKIPTATIGIRGTIVAGEVGTCSAKEKTSGKTNCDGFKVSNFQGNVTVTVNGGQTMTVAPGDKVTFDGGTGQTQTTAIAAGDVTPLPQETQSGPQEQQQQQFQAPATQESTAAPPTPVPTQTESSGPQPPPPLPPPPPPPTP